MRLWLIVIFVCGQCMLFAQEAKEKSKVDKRIEAELRDETEEERRKRKMKEIEMDIELELETDFVDDKQFRKAKQIEREKQEFHRVEFGYELDAYYSNVYMMVNLTSEPVPDAGEKGELGVYKDLLFSSHLPRFFIIEASVYPLPVAGVYLKQDQQEFYNSARATDELNFVQAVTTGHEEPYAASLFFGNVLGFSKAGEEMAGTNKAYLGYLFSIGDRHIVNNELVDDVWYEFEWKFKGDRRFKEEVLSWSFQIGFKWHDNPDIKDIVYIGLRRSLTDFNASWLSLFKNSGIEYRMDMTYKELWKAIRHRFVVDKKWPVKKLFAFTLAFGFIWESQTKYTGSLSEQARGENLQFIIQPNVTF